MSPDELVRGPRRRAKGGWCHLGWSVGVRWRALAAIVGLVALTPLAPQLLNHPSPDTSRRPRIEMVSVQPDRMGPTAEGSARIVVTYRTAGKVLRTRIDKITGPAVERVRVRAVHRASGYGSGWVQSVAIDIRCGVASRAASYRLTARRTDRHGRTSLFRVKAPTVPVSLGTAARTVCFERQATEALSVTKIRRTARSWDSDRLIVEARLANAGAVPLSVRTLDVADVSSLEDADAAVLAASQSRWLLIRLPAHCSVPDSAPTAMAWAVGPVGGEPRTVVRTALSTGHLWSLNSLLARYCAATSSASVRDP